MIFSYFWTQAYDIHKGCLHKWSTNILKMEQLYELYTI